MTGMTQWDIAQDAISSMKYFQYKILAAHMFEWKGLPAGLTSEKLELMLIDRGSVCFFNTDTGFYILPYSSNGMVNVYGDLLNTSAVTMNGLQLRQLDDIPRILWDNAVRQTFNRYLMVFAARLGEIQKSISISERQARYPTIMATNEENRESFNRFVSKIDEGYPVIEVDATMNLDAFRVLPTGFSAEIFGALWDDYNKVEGEVYALLGTMFNVEQNKAAGVGPAETIINYSQTFALANSRLKQRQDWCDKINAEFGIGISCDKASDYQDLIQEVMNGNIKQPDEAPNETEGDSDADDTE